MPHQETVRHIYAAFGRGDVAAILQHLDEEVAWEYAAASTDVPWLQPRRGRAQVPRFFESMSQFELHRFEPRTFLESGNVVVVLIDVELTVRASGRRIVEEDEVHIWHFNAQGKISRFAHKLDTHAHWAAYHGANTEMEQPAG